MRRPLLLAAISLLTIGVAFTYSQQRPAGDMVARIRAEGLQRSKALALYRTLTDDIGARLTGSPAHMRAAGWARDRFLEWGLINPHLEPYEFGRGWSLERISVEMTTPRYFPLIAYPDAWSPSVAGVVSGRVVYVGDKTASSRTSRRPSSSRPIGRSPDSTIVQSPRVIRRWRRRAARRRWPNSCRCCSARAPPWR
jgi:hypothetical protein